MSPKNEYYFLKIKDLTLVEAVPYTRSELGNRKRTFLKQPNILLRDNKGFEFSILDTSTFSRFIMVMDEEVSFLDCNNWMSMCIDGELDFYDLILSFMEDYNDASFGAWVRSGIIHGIDDGAFDTKSKYLMELFEQLPVYLFGKSNTWHSFMKMSKIKGKLYPTLAYHDGKKHIEIVCATQRTKVVGRYEVGDGFIQPTTHSKLPYWAHLAPIEELVIEVNKHLDKLNSIEGKELPDQPFTKSRANSLEFKDRNRLEYENYLLIFQ
tara:strand:- start:3041 stop:3838 length:798 start_codon:yes stop_codon:yes gene_type:complete